MGAQTTFCRIAFQVKIPDTQSKGVSRHISSANKENNLYNFDFGNQFLAFFHKSEKSENSQRSEKKLMMFPLLRCFDNDD